MVSVQFLSSCHDPHPVGGALPPHVVLADQASVYMFLSLMCHKDQHSLRNKTSHKNTFLPMYQKATSVEGKLLPYPSTVTVAYFLPPFSTPEGLVTQCITCKETQYNESTVSLIKYERKTAHMKEAWQALCSHAYLQACSDKTVNVHICKYVMIGALHLYFPRAIHS